MIKWGKDNLQVALEKLVICLQKKAKMNLSHSFTPYVKVTWKSDTDLRVRVITLEDLEENIIENFCDLGLDNISEHTKNIKHKRKIDRSDFIKILKFCSLALTGVAQSWCHPTN